MRYGQFTPVNSWDYCDYDYIDDCHSFVFKNLNSSEIKFVPSFAIMSPSHSIEKNHNSSRNRSHNSSTNGRFK